MLSGRPARRVLLVVLACVLLVAALAGQPAWGIGPTPQLSNATAQPGPAAGPQVAGDEPVPDPASDTSTDPKPISTGDPMAAPTPAPTMDPTGDPKPVPTDPIPDPTADPTPDPTPASPDDARPVEVPGGTAPQEQGAETPAAPQTPETPDLAPAMASPEQAQLESLSRSSSNGQLLGEAFGAAGLVARETPDTGSALQAPTTVTPGPPTNDSLLSPSGTGSGPAADSPRPGAIHSSDQPTGEAPNRSQPQAGSQPPGPTNPTPGPQPTGRPIQDGPVLQAPARELTQTPSGTHTSRPRAAGAPGIGTIGEPSKIGLHQVANLVKDIPAWIEIALAGLAALVLLLGSHSVLAAARARRLERQRTRLMEDIGLLQAALLPAVPGRLGALLTTVAYRPADGPAAGGDFYDAFALSDGRVGLLLGDISGHGRQALAKTTLVRFTVRAHLEAGMSPREALAISGRSLDGRLADDFSTVIAAIHDPVKGTLTYASAGHPAPLVIGPPAHEPVTASSAPPIGAGFPTGQRQTVLPMPDGSTVAIYSDGLIEARVEGEMLGRDRLAEWLAQLGPEATAKALLDLVVQRADGVEDDLAAVVLHAAPGASAPAARVEQLKLDVLDVDGPELEGFLRASGVSRADRAIASRRVAEQLAVSGGVVVEVRMGEHPMVSVAPIGDHAAGGTLPSRAR